MSTLDPAAHFDAVQAAIDAHLGQWRSYDYGEVPGSSLNLTKTAGATVDVLPARYVLLTVGRRYQPLTSYGGTTDSSLWRITTRAVATDGAGVRWLADRITEALNEQPLTVSGVDTTLIQFENETPLSEDDGRMAALASWTYSI